MWQGVQHLTNYRTNIGTAEGDLALAEELNIIFARFEATGPETAQPHQAHSSIIFTFEEHEYSGEARKQKANELLAKLRFEQSALLRPSTAQESATRASYQISSLIAKSGRAFATGEFVKECLAVAAEAVCPSQVRMFSQISLSRNTVTRRIEDMAQDIGEQIKTKASAFSAYSIACDESTDISDSAQLLVFLRGVNETFEVTQELAGIETLSGTTKGQDLFFAVERVLEKNELKWEKMAGITTDGAPAMKPRGIILQFTMRHFRDALWKAAKNSPYLTKHHLRLAEDLFPEDRERRNKLWPLVEKARQQGRRAYFVGPKAYIDGKELVLQDMEVTE
ncbi:general transcription factor II-I repeat domain-containing 2-like protein [Labeo rohita]|uniref:General transcription factor II-I repeat domain-containing 2-like protein n=1 Tax=Labeo rohita TaxID=84645 RepID=A0A498MCH8_LABRO|nr:general transcription factor II-I repeat domain-containing 2-like protein [Labeo rohita]